MKPEIEEALLEASALDILLVRMRIDLDSFTHVDGKAIHKIACIPDAYCDGEYVLFRNKREDARKKFFYYIGAENEAKCVWHDGEWSMYDGLSEERINRIYDEDELTLAEALAEKIEGSTS